MEKIDIVAEVRKQKNALMIKLDSLKNIQDDSERKDALDAIYKEVDELKLYTNQQISGRISHEISMCNALLKELDQRLSKERDVKRSAFKFSMNLKDKFAKKAISTNVGDKPQKVPEESRDSVDFYATTKVLQNLKNEKRTLATGEVDSQNLVLDHLEDCEIFIHGSPQSIRLVNLERCRIFTGPVCTSVFISNCNGCTFQIIAQQIRIHTSTDCDVFQHINSRSIIETCRGFRFGPYSHTYEGLDADFEKSTITRDINNWRDVDDFDCLTPPSPNWSLIE